MILGTSTLFAAFNDLKFFMSAKTGGFSAPPYYLNMSFNVGDDEVTVKKNRQIFYNAIKISEQQIAQPRQVHSDVAKIADEPGYYDNCDALITNKKDLFLSISVADCVPVFLYDSKNKVIAAVHSGWQGSEKRILTKTLELMKQDFGCKTCNIFAHIGYSAGSCCYEVGTEVAQKFPESFINPKNDSKFLLDLKSFNKSLLLDTGIPQNQIEVSQFCTICNPEFLHSYRRDGQKSGRMNGIIGMIQPARLGD